jgi:hypothetical protein
MIDFERNVVIGAKALAQARQQLGLIGGSHVARPDIDGLANVVKRTSRVLSIYTRGYDEIHMGLIEYPFGCNQRQKDLRT